MKKKGLKHTNVLQAMSIGLAAVMTLTPMTTYAAEPDGNAGGMDPDDDTHISNEETATVEKDAQAAAKTVGDLATEVKAIQTYADTAELSIDKQTADMTQAVVDLEGYVLTDLNEAGTALTGAAQGAALFEQKLSLSADEIKDSDLALGLASLATLDVDKQKDVAEQEAKAAENSATSGEAKVHADAAKQASDGADAALKLAEQKLEEADSALQTASEDVAAAETAAKEAEKKVDAAAEELREAQENAEQAKNKAKALQEALAKAKQDLLQAKTSTQGDYDAAYTAYTNARSAWEGAANQKSLSETELKSAQENYNAAESQLESARSAASSALSAYNTKLSAKQAIDNEIAGYNAQISSLDTRIRETTGRKNTQETTAGQLAATASSLKTAAEEADREYETAKGVTSSISGNLNTAKQEYEVLNRSTLTAEDTLRSSDSTKEEKTLAASQILASVLEDGTLVTYDSTEDVFYAGEGDARRTFRVGVTDAGDVSVKEITEGSGEAIKVAEQSFYGSKDAGKYGDKLEKQGYAVRYSVQYQATPYGSYYSYYTVTAYEKAFAVIPDDYYSYHSYKYALGDDFCEAGYIDAYRDPSGKLHEVYSNNFIYNDQGQLVKLTKQQKKQVVTAIGITYIARDTTPQEVNVATLKDVTQQLSEASSKVQRLQSSYDQAVINEGIAKQNAETAQTSYENAERNAGSAKSGLNALIQDLADLDEEKGKLQAKLTDALGRAQSAGQEFADAERTKGIADSNLTGADSNFTQASSRLQAARSADSQNLLTKNSTYQTYQNAGTTLAGKESLRDTALQAYNAAYEEYSRKAENATTLLGKAQQALTDLETAQQKVTALQEQVDLDSRAFGIFRAELLVARADLESAQERYNACEKEVETARDAAKEALAAVAQAYAKVDALIASENAEASGASRTDAPIVADTSVTESEMLVVTLGNTPLMLDEEVLGADRNTIREENRTSPEQEEILPEEAQVAPSEEASAQEDTDSAPSDAATLEIEEEDVAKADRILDALSSDKTQTAFGTVIGIATTISAAVIGFFFLLFGKKKNIGVDIHKDSDRD